MASRRVRSSRASGAAAVGALVLLVGAIAGCDVGTDFTVTSTADVVDADPGDGLCATATDECTLRAAVQETEALGASATIHLAPGATYTLTIVGRFEDASATGDLDIGAPFTHLVGNGATVDAGSLDRVLDHHAGTLQVDDLTITHGAGGHGAGLRNSGVANLVRVNLLANSISGDSGTGPEGVAIEHLDGQLNIVGGEVSGNVQTGTSGRSATILQVGGSATIAGSVIRGNEGNASLQWVGTGTYAAFLQEAGSAVIADTDIVDNETTEIREVCIRPGSCSYQPFTHHVVGALVSGDVEVRHSRLSGNTDDLATSGPAYGDHGTATVRVGASAVNRCTATGVTSRGYNRFGAASCSAAPTDVGPFTATIDQIPVGTPLLCDATTPPDRDGVTRPQGPACDIGPLEQ